MDKNEKMSWQEIPVGAVVTDAGSASAYQTGDWRSNRPIFHAERCIQCFLCWIYCPDASIIAKDGKVVGIDYYHCKGCGICSQECPVKGDKAITMIDESEAEEGTGAVNAGSEAS
jgi:2-oxoacid:acceptor oxidoreductase delta subunit (pyruvate/2-ketoisovalerate family)